MAEFKIGCIFITLLGPNFFLILIFLFSAVLGVNI